MHAADIPKTFFEAALGLIYPPCCAACGKRLPTGSHLCTECFERAKTVARPFCRKCSQPFDGIITSEFTCVTCADRTLYFDHAVAARRNLGVVRELVHRFKYSRQSHIKHALAPWLIESLQDPRITPFDLIVPVPLHHVRQRERGFNQARRLANVASKFTGKPVVSLLCRTRNTRTQTRLHRKERMQNLRGAFALTGKCDPANQRILLVDDVFTTGSTVNECARVLRACHVSSVQVATVARS